MVIWTLASYVLSWLEVRYAVMINSVSANNNACPRDQMPADRLPSVALGNACDRILADIDQDGFLFASDPRDEEVFNRRSKKVPRLQNTVQVVLSGGTVCVQKRRLVIQYQRTADRFREAIAWDFYLEAAALLRLRTVRSVPGLRRINPRERMIEMEYIWGENLHHHFAAGNEMPYEDVKKAFWAAVRDRGHHITEQLASVLHQIRERGVIPRDIHPANFIIGCYSGNLYIVDFQVIHLWPVPGWRARLRELDCLFTPQA